MSVAAENDVIGSVKVFVEHLGNKLASRSHEKNNKSGEGATSWVTLFSMI